MKAQKNEGPSSPVHHPWFEPIQEAVLNLHGRTGLLTIFLRAAAAGQRVQKGVRRYPRGCVCLRTDYFVTTVK